MKLLLILLAFNQVCSASDFVEIKRLTDKGLSKLSTTLNIIQGELSAEETFSIGRQNFGYLSRERSAKLNKIVREIISRRFSGHISADSIRVQKTPNARGSFIEAAHSVFDKVKLKDGQEGAFNEGLLNCQGQKHLELFTASYTSSFEDCKSIVLVDTKNLELLDIYSCKVER